MWASGLAQQERITALRTVAPGTAHPAGQRMKSSSPAMLEGDGRSPAPVVRLEADVHVPARIRFQRSVLDHHPLGVPVEPRCRSRTPGCRPQLRRARVRLG
jgi:hypothetical protein